MGGDQEQIFENQSVTDENEKEYDDFDEEYEEEEYLYDDFEESKKYENMMENKENMKEEKKFTDSDDESNEESDEDKKNEKDEEEIELKITKSKRTYRVNNFIQEYEFAAILGALAEKIANSEILVPEKSLDILDPTGEGNSLKIAIQWIYNRKKFPLPDFIICERKINRTVQRINIQKSLFFFEIQMFDTNQEGSMSFFENFTS